MRGRAFAAGFKGAGFGVRNVFAVGGRVEIYAVPARARYSLTSRFKSPTTPLERGRSGGGGGAYGNR
jgi:hypothetical protein